MYLSHSDSFCITKLCKLLNSFIFVGVLDVVVNLSGLLKNMFCILIELFDCFEL